MAEVPIASQTRIKKNLTWIFTTAGYGVTWVDDALVYVERHLTRLTELPRYLSSKFRIAK
jgi:hypothetical protein